MDDAKFSPPDPQASTVCAQVFPKKILLPGDKILTRIGDLSTDHAGCAQRLSTEVVETSTGSTQDLWTKISGATCEKDAFPQYPQPLLLLLKR